MIMAGIASYDNGKEVQRFLETRRITNQTIPLILLLDASQAICMALSLEYGIEVCQITLPPDFWTVEPLGLNKWGLLQEKIFYKYDEVIFFTDIKDVIFQKKIEVDIQPNEIILQQENKKFGNCITNRKWINNHKYDEKYINSAGGFIGHSKDLQVMAEDIIENKWKSSSDQGAFNNFIFENTHGFNFTTRPDMWRVAQDDYWGVNIEGVEGVVEAKDGSVPALFHFAGDSKKEKLRHIYNVDNLREMTERYDALERFNKENK